MKVCIINVYLLTLDWGYFKKKIFYLEISWFKLVKRLIKFSQLFIMHILTICEFW